jgi:hypothetical protein
MRRLRDIEAAAARPIRRDPRRHPPRDERDMGRADSPLRPAADAHLLDTSEMSIEAAFQAARTSSMRVLGQAERRPDGASFASLRKSEAPAFPYGVGIPACQHSSAPDAAYRAASGH